MPILMYIFRSGIKRNITSMYMLVDVAGWAFGGIIRREAYSPLQFLWARA
jgi:hypothetical protein